MKFVGSFIILEFESGLLPFKKLLYQGYPQDQIGILWKKKFAGHIYLYISYAIVSMLLVVRKGDASNVHSKKCRYTYLLRMQTQQSIFYVGYQKKAIQMLNQNKLVSKDTKLEQRNNCGNGKLPSWVGEQAKKPVQHQLNRCQGKVDISCYFLAFTFLTLARSQQSYNRTEDEGANHYKSWDRYEKNTEEERKFKWSDSVKFNQSACNSIC